MTQYQEIMCKLIEKGITQKEIAEAMGVSKSTVSTVIRGVARSYMVEKAITEITGYKFPPMKKVPLTLAKKLKKEVKEVADKILEERQVENA